MPTLQAKVESYTGALSAGEQTNLSDFICHGANKLIATLPPQVIKRNATATSVTSSGLTIANARLFYVKGSASHEALQVSPADIARHTGSTSIFKVSDVSPIWYEDGGKIYVVNGDGAAGSGTAYIISYLTSVTIGSDTSITSLPLQAERLAILDAAISVLSSRANDKIKTTLAGQTYTGITVPTAPTALDLTTPYNELNTVLDTDEDVELAQAKLQEINQRIGEYQASVQKYNSDIAIYAQKLTGYNADLQKVIQEYAALPKQIQLLKLLYNQDLQWLMTGMVLPDKGKDE